MDLHNMPKTCHGIKLQCFNLSPPHQLGVGVVYPIHFYLAIPQYKLAFEQWCFFFLYMVNKMEKTEDKCQRVKVAFVWIKIYVMMHMWMAISYKAHYKVSLVLPWTEEKQN